MIRLPIIYKIAIWDILRLEIILIPIILLILHTHDSLLVDIVIIILISNLKMRRN